MAIYFRIINDTLDIYIYMSNFLDTLKAGISQNQSILVGKFPIKALSLSKNAISKTIEDIKANRGSRSKEPIEVMYNIYSGQFVITDGYHRVVEYISKRKLSIPAKVWSTTYSDYYANIQINDLFFQPIDMRNYPDNTLVLPKPKLKEWVKGFVIQVLKEHRYD